MKKRFKVKQMEANQESNLGLLPEKAPDKPEPMVEAAPVVADGYTEWDMTEPVRGDKPIEIVDQAAPAYAGPPRTLAELHVQILKQRDNPPPAYVPPPPTERQSEQTRLEMEAGRKAVGKHAIQQASRPQPPHDPREGNAGVPVVRTGSEQEYPNLRGFNQSKEMGARNV